MVTTHFSVYYKTMFLIRDVTAFQKLSRLIWISMFLFFLFSETTRVYFPIFFFSDSDTELKVMNILTLFSH